MDVIGCGIDVAWLTATMGAMFRLFPEQPVIHLMLKTGCRDGPEEVGMIGFLSEQRIFAVDAGNPDTCTLLDIAENISGVRRSRSWRAPGPFESGLCVYVNIVSSMAKQEGWEQMVKPAPVPTGYKGIAYFHLNLRIDQLAADEWDFRIFHYDAAFGPNWVNCFVHGLTRCIGEMASNPTAPLRTPCVLPFKPAVQAAPQKTWQPWTPTGTWSNWPAQQGTNGNNGSNGNGWSNGRTETTAAEPPTKMARIEAADHQPPAIAAPVLPTPAATTPAMITEPMAPVAQPIVNGNGSTEAAEPPAKIARTGEDAPANVADDESMN